MSSWSTNTLANRRGDSAVVSVIKCSTNLSGCCSGPPLTMRQKRVQSHMVDIRIWPLWVHQQKPERHMFQALPNCENDLAVDECSGLSCA